jgi:hypothetical protein
MAIGDVRPQEQQE